MSGRSAGIVGGASLIGLGAALVLRRIRAVAREEEERKKYTLILEATSGGTIHPSPDTYVFDSPTRVTVTAVPLSGYIFDGWYLSGVNVSTELTYIVNVNGNVLLTASFTKEGAPPLIPSYIKPIQNCSVEEWWRARRVPKPGTIPGLDHSMIRLEAWLLWGDFVRFKICDTAGNGISGQAIAVYTDPNPDETDYGYVYLNDEEHTQGNPLILISDANGVVTCLVTYVWREAGDFRYTIGSAIRGYYWCVAGVWGGDEYPMYDGITVLYPCYWDKIVRLKHPIFRNVNYVHAYWVDNPSLLVMGDAVADCMVKILGEMQT